MRIGIFDLLLTQISTELDVKCMWCPPFIIHIPSPQKMNPNRWRDLLTIPLTTTPTLDAFFHTFSQTKILKLCLVLLCFWQENSFDFKQPMAFPVASLYRKWTSSFQHWQASKKCRLCLLFFNMLSESCWLNPAILWAVMNTAMSCGHKQGFRLVVLLILVRNQTVTGRPGT